MNFLQSRNWNIQGRNGKKHLPKISHLPKIICEVRGKGRNKPRGPRTLFQCLIHAGTTEFGNPSGKHRKYLALQEAI